MDWRTFEHDTRNLAQTITEVPDLVVAVARGGLIPATLLAKLLKVHDVYAVQLHREGEKRRIAADIFGDVAGKKVLLVEDMIETGRGLIIAKAFLEEHGAQVKTACLYTMPISEIRPDYSLREVREVVAFPWNVL